MFELRSTCTSAFLLFALSSCIGGKVASTPSSPPISHPQQVCAKDFQLPIPSGSTGEANVYLVDPATSAGDASLSPGSSSLGNFTDRVQLEHLLGRGTLSGAYVEVVSGYCGYAPGAFHPQNQFVYPVGDGRFAEAMDYYHGDRFRSRLDEASALLPQDPIRIIANCPYQDNAFYTRDEDEEGNPIDLVCMGLSRRFTQGNLSHDAQVTIHELQHATTTYAYSASEDMNRFFYDDAGSINEGISDFVALMMTEEEVPHTLDARVFSRWALGALIGNQARGVTRCPTFDPGYPNCPHYRADAAGFDAEENHISFSYPDGLGWPMGTTRSGPAFVRNHFTTNYSMEEIHQDAVIAAGVLWDAYGNLKALMSISAAQLRMLKLITETLRALPKPNAATDLSPVTYPGFGEKLVQTAGLLGWPASERNAIKEATDARGLTSAAQLPAGWAGVGPGKLLTPGIQVIDMPESGSVANGRLNRGDLAAVFFDIRNHHSLTAGSVLLDATTDSSRIAFLDREHNEGYLSPSRAMIRYGKVNGTAIVAALSSPNSSYHVPTGNTYFQTNPNYGDYESMTTALYVKVPQNAPIGATEFTVRIKPANGAEVTLSFPVEIRQ